MNLFDQSLPLSEWRRRKADYEARVRPWVEDRVRRSSRQVKHPVYDFLFEYYSFRPSYLGRWSPGVAVRLEGATRADVGWGRLFADCDSGIVLTAAAFPARRVEYLDWAVAYLEAVAGREPSFGCFGLHEWAMVYRTPEIRHSHLPLRRTSGEIAEVVEGQGLRCTHYDAFRFFSPDARPRNRVQLTRADAAAHDQPGCVHANMDLYRFAYMIAPFGTAELIAEAFELAVAARELDMRASPYDLRRYRFEPLEIETKAGREEYTRLQRNLVGKAVALREQVLVEYRWLQSLVGRTG